VTWGTWIREKLFVVIGIHENAEADLMGVAQTDAPSPLSLALAKAGSSKAARMAMTAMTTSSSINVKPKGTPPRSLLKGEQNGPAWGDAVTLPIGIIGDVGGGVALFHLLDGRPDDRAIEMADVAPFGSELSGCLVHEGQTLHDG